MRLAHQSDDPVSTRDRLVSGDLRHFEALKRRRTFVLSYVIRGGGVLGEAAEHILRQPHREILGHVDTVVGVGTGLAARRRNVAVGICTGHAREGYPSIGD